jgi:hypothetical protein
VSLTTLTFATVLAVLNPRPALGSKSTGYELRPNIRFCSDTPINRTSGRTS